MSKNNPQASIQSLIFSLFPIHPRAINEQLFHETFARIKDIWIALESRIQVLNSNKFDQEVISSTNVCENLQKKLETLKEARKKHFRTGMLSNHWWPTPDDIFLANRVPAYSHTFLIQEKVIFFTLKENSPEGENYYSPKKKFYFLASVPIEQYDSIIQLSFQYRSPKDKERAKLGRQPKQERINKSNLNTLIELFKKFKIPIDTNSASFNERLSFHLSLFTQRNDPIILYKNLSNYYTDLISKFWLNTPENHLQDKLYFNKKKKAETDLLRPIESWYLHEIIQLLSSYEDLLISIWSKKSLVTQTEYIISLDKLAEWTGMDFIKKIAGSIISNEKQMKEWTALYKIDENTIKTHIKNFNLDDSLPLDTRHFNMDFKWQLLNALPDIPLHDLLDGYVYNSDNWYALNSLQNIWRGKIKCIYIDPPYNTGNDDFVYRDNFSRFEWMVMLRNRLEIAKTYLSAEDGVIIISIDDNEMANLKLLLDEIFENNSIGPIIVQTNPRGRTLDKHIAKTHEYLLLYALNKDHANTLFKIPKNKQQLAEYNKVDDKGRSYRLIELRNRNPRFNRTNRPNLYYPLYTNPQSHRISVIQSRDFPIEILPKTSRNRDDCWTWSKEKTLANLDLLVSKKVSTGAWRIFRRNYLDDGGEASTTKEKSIWTENSLSNERGREQFRDLFGLSTHHYPKSVDYIGRIIQLATEDNQVIMDFFAGSGTTAHSVMRLNQKNQTKNKFILIEKSNQFKNVILPRIKKLSYSYQWKEGSPLDKNGSGVFVQYQIFEQPLEEISTREALGKVNSQNQLQYDFKGFKMRYKVKPLQNPFNTVPESIETDVYIFTSIDYFHTCNLLIGLNPSTIRYTLSDGKYYLFFLGVVNNKRTIIAWRDTITIDFLKDKNILLENFRKFKCEQIFVNNSSELDQYTQAESVFKMNYPS